MSRHMCGVGLSVWGLLQSIAEGDHATPGDQTSERAAQRHVTTCGATHRRKAMTAGGTDG